MTKYLNPKFSVPMGGDDTYRSNWESIFGPKEPEDSWTEAQTAVPQIALRRRAEDVLERILHRIDGTGPDYTEAIDAEDRILGYIGKLIRLGDGMVTVGSEMSHLMPDDPEGEDLAEGFEDLVEEWEKLTQ